MDAKAKTEQKSLTNSLTPASGGIRGLVVAAFLSSCTPTPKENSRPAWEGDPKKLPAEISAAIESAQLVTLYSLNGAFQQDGAGFHGIRIVGSATINDPSRRATIAKTLRRELGDDAGSGVMCFDPYHGLRIVAGGTTYDLIITSECGHVHIYTTGRPWCRLSGTLAISGLLDSILGAANVPFLPRPH